MVQLFRGKLLLVSGQSHHVGRSGLHRNKKRERAPSPSRGVDGSDNDSTILILLPLVCIGCLAFLFQSFTLSPVLIVAMAPALLTAVDATSHIHLIVGSNPLAGARCTRSIEVGAKPVLLAPEDATLHYGLAKRIEAGEVKWLKRSFTEDDLTTLGRAEVDGVVDAVFITAGGKNGSGR